MPGVDPVMVLTPLGTDGRFNNNLVTALMEDRRLQERLSGSWDGR